MQFATEDSIPLLKLVGGRHYAHFRRVHKSQDSWLPDSDRSQDRTYDKIFRHFRIKSAGKPQNRNLAG